MFLRNDLINGPFMLPSRAMARAADAPGRSMWDHQRLADLFGDVIIEFGPDGTPRFVSPNCRGMLGAAPSTIIQEGLTPLLHPDDRAAEAALRVALSTNEIASGSLICRMAFAAAGEMWVEIRACRAVDPATGAFDGLVMVVRDITQRQLTDQANSRNAERYRLLAENTSDAITYLDLDLTQIYVSPTFTKMFGYQPEDVIGKPRGDIVHPEDRRLVKASLQRLASGDEQESMVVYRLRHADGHYVCVESHFLAVTDPRTLRPASITCSVRDVSERQAQNEALQRMNAELQRVAAELASARDRAESASLAKTRFLASISHELRTPLNGILGYAELLRLDGQLTTTQSSRIDAMLSAGQHLLEMINSVLDLSEIETGQMELHPSVVDLQHTVGACVDLLRPASRNKRLTLDLSIGLEVPKYILVDRTRLRQILLNLLGNAVKFTSAGGVALRVSADAAARVLRFEVADTGPGVPADKREHIFQDFERLESHIEQSVEGSGLGLALARRLVGLMNGHLTYSENPAGGSVFSFTIQLHAVAATPSPDSRPTEKRLSRPARKLRVLVVDDVAMNRDVAGSFLRAAGHCVTFAEDGETALHVAALEDFDVILMDVRMPGIDGLEATRQIRALPAPRGNVPIIALTAQAFVEQVDACYSVGMTSHLAKPFNQRDLLTIVEHVARADPQTGARDDGASALGDCFARESWPADRPHAKCAAATPVFDQSIFEMTSQFLPGDGMAAYLRALQANAQALLDRLRFFEGDTTGHLGLVDAAHALAGSAAMFGFTRLSNAAREFERTAHNNPADSRRAGDVLCAALADTLTDLPGIMKDTLSTSLMET